MLILGDSLPFGTSEKGVTKKLFKRDHRFLHVARISINDRGVNKYLSRVGLSFHEFRRLGTQKRIVQLTRE